MKKTRALISFAILLTLVSYAHAGDLGILRTSLIEGDVRIRTNYTEEWFPASINMPLVDGDRFWVAGGGRLEIQLRDGSLLRLDGNSSLTVNFRDADSPQFYLSEGRAYINFKGERGSHFRIDTPVSSIYSYDPALFSVDISSDRSAQASVLRGIIYAENRYGRTRISAGNMITLDDNNYTEISRLEPPDLWERWNRDRDRELEDKRYSHRYLPEELRKYSYDFDEYGDWIYTGDYGYVWRPTVIISSGWSPYRLGRWTWRGSDYVWVSYEPWGWAPYHYGRWSHTASIGWFWVPPLRGEVYWGPGFVGWVHTPTYVAWVPLAPREIYYGRGYFGPYSVNIVNVTVHKTVVRPVYKNVHIHNSVTVVHNDTFVKGKRVDIRIKENPFLDRKARFGTPEIKREKALFMPIVSDADKKISQETRVRKQRSEDNYKTVSKRSQQQSFGSGQKYHTSREYSVTTAQPASGRSVNKPEERKQVYYRDDRRTEQQSPMERSRHSVKPTGDKEKERIQSRIIEVPREKRKPPSAYVNPRHSEPGKSGARIRESSRETDNFRSSVASSRNSATESRVQRIDKKQREYRNGRNQSQLSNKETITENPVRERTRSPEVRKQADNSNSGRFITEKRQKDRVIEKRNERGGDNLHIRDSRFSKGSIYSSGTRENKGAFSGRPGKIK